MKIHEYGNGIQYWYDRPTRSWWCALFDEEGNQIDDASFAYTKQEIISECALMVQEAD